MKGIISRVFAKRSESARGSPLSGLSSELGAGDIEHYYKKIIVDCLRRLLVPSDSVEIVVRRTGAGDNGRVAFAGYVRILKWDPVLTPVLLQNMPVIDIRVRKMVRASVILEGTNFGGLWFQATCIAEGAPTSLLGLPCELIHHPGGAS